MKRLIAALALLGLVGGYHVAPAEAQGRFWVLVNGALRYTGNITVGSMTSTGILSTSVNGIATTSTDGLILQNTTAATSGATVQMSPRLRWGGTAWNTASSSTVDFFLENLPATAATPTGTFKLGYSLAGAAATYPLTVSSAGLATTLLGVTMGATGQLVGSGAYQIVNGGGTGLLKITNQAQSTGVGLNVATNNIIAIRTMALTADAAIRASFYSSSTVSTLTISSDTIAPTLSFHHVGAGLIKTITVPATCTPTCQITLIPDAAFTYDATGNIVVPSGGGTATIGRAMSFTWDGTSWYPSY